MTSHVTLQTGEWDSASALPRSTRRRLSRSRSRSRSRLLSPLRSFGWALEWHRITRRIDAEHAAEIRQQLNRLAGTPLGTVLSAPGLLSVRLGGRSVTMQVTASRPSEALSRAADRGARLVLAGAGQYGRFWWVAFDNGAGDSAAPRIVVLARRVVVAADPDAGGSRPMLPLHPLGCPAPAY